MRQTNTHSSQSNNVLPLSGRRSALRSKLKAVRTEKKEVKQLKWAGCYADGWEILLYQGDRHWEACFFKWEIHHEHLKAPSIESARCRAEERIDAIEESNVTVVVWPAIAT